MSKFAKIPCIRQNHGNMNFQYICLNQTCLNHNKWLCCLNCCQEEHHSHKDKITSIKGILIELADKHHQQSQKQKQITEYNTLGMLLEGMQTCSSYEYLKTNLRELLAYRSNPKRYQKILDEQMQSLHTNTQRHYQRIHQQQTARSLSEKSSLMDKPYITPVLNFKESHLYTFNSPFCVTNRQNELVTVWAYPSLSKFHESVDLRVKIERYTPSWIGVGLSIGQTKYEQKSPKHLLAISNGWISNRGVLQKSKVRFGGGDQVRLRWNKNTELLQLISKRDKETIRFENRWNEDVYLCVCLFYKGDSVSILS